jgi:hypothetical protein
MINLNVSTTIYRPIHQVFDFACAPENDFLWQYGTLASNRLSEDFGHANTYFRSIGHLMGQRIQSTFEVTEYEPGRSYCFRSLSGPLNSYTSYTFEWVGGCTVVNISTQINLINSMQVNENILEKKMRKQLKENLALLKHILEARQMPLSYQANHSSTLMDVQ